MRATESDNIALLKRFRILAYMLVGLAVAGFAYAEENPAILVLALGGMGISWWMVEMGKTRLVPRWLINLGVLAAAVVLYYELAIYQQENILRALGHFMVAILMCKLFEQKQARDYTQILTLTLLIMVAGCIFSQSLLFGLILIVYLLLGLYMILVFHLWQETQQAALARQIPEDWRQLPERHDTFRMDMRRISVYVAVALLVIAGVAFPMFPRGRAHDLLASWSIGSASRTGFSDRVRFSDVGRIQQSEAEVMEVKLEQNGINIGSEYTQPYFRGIALDTYDARERYWLRSAYASSVPTTREFRQRRGMMTPDGGGVPRDPTGYFSRNRLAGDLVERTLSEGYTALVDERRYNPLGLVSQHYTIHAMSGNLLFTVSWPVAIHSEEFNTVGFSPSDLMLNVRGRVSSPLRYTLDSAVVFKPDLSQEEAFVEPGDLGMPQLGPGVEATRVPPEVTAIARDVVRDLLPDGGGTNALPAAQNVRPIADAVEAWLRKNYPYNLSFRSVDRNLDPTADFLVNRKASGGHCEYFASAMVMMCRSLGVNARMVTGYRGGEFNSLGGYYVVKQKHAHAWVEVFVPNRGWTLFDPTPGGTEVAAASTSSWTRWFSEVSEIIQKSWLSTVVSFDNNSRQFIFGTVGALMENVANFFRGLLENVMEGFGSLFVSSAVSTPVRLVGILAMLFIVGGVGWLARSIHRRRHSEVERMFRNLDRGAHKQRLLELMFFDDLLRVLARAGARKLPEQTPREYVDALAPRLRDAVADARWMVKTFYDIRFGTVRSSPALQRHIGTALIRLREQISRG